MRKQSVNEESLILAWIFISQFCVIKSLKRLKLFSHKGATSSGHTTVHLAEGSWLNDMIFEE
jgi:hypothetical protein